jgi:hypothetical protein
MYFEFWQLMWKMIIMKITSNLLETGMEDIVLF